MFVRFSSFGGFTLYINWIKASSFCCCDSRHFLFFICRRRWSCRFSGRRRRSRRRWQRQRQFVKLVARCTVVARAAHRLQAPLGSRRIQPKQLEAFTVQENRSICRCVGVGVEALPISWAQPLQSCVPKPHGLHRPASLHPSESSLSSSNSIRALSFFKARTKSWATRDS